LLAPCILKWSRGLSRFERHAGCFMCARAVFVLLLDPAVEFFALLLCLCHLVFFWQRLREE
jgi:hypothetical protein